MRGRLSQAARRFLGRPRASEARGKQAPGCPLPFPLDQNRIAKFMRPVAHGVQFLPGSPQCRVIRECSQQLVMAGAGLMNSRKNRVDNAELAFRADALRRQPIAGMHPAVPARGVLQCAYHRRADCNNAAATRPCALHGGGG